MKIVINKCYGGFGLSNKALEEVAKLKGYELYHYKQTHYKSKDGKERFKRVDNSSDIFVNTFTKDFGEIATKDDIDWKTMFYDGNLERTDEHLISVVEKLGDEANGRYASLRVVEIPDDISWEMSDYDGIETIHECHMSW